MKKIATILLALTMMVGMYGCTDKDEKDTTNVTAKSSETLKETTTEAQTQETNNNFVIRYPESLVEDFGEELVMDKTPERVICMTGGPVQTLYELDVEMLAIPDSTMTTWAPDLTAKKLPFGMNQVDMEGILALEPDFVILSTGNKDKYGSILEDKGISCYYVKAGPFVTFDDIKTEVKLLGEGFNKTEKTQEILNRFEDVEGKMNEYKNNNESQNMTILFGYPPAMTLSSNSYLGDIFAKLGYTNLSDENNLTSSSTQGSYTINMEELVNVNPNLLIACSPSAPKFEDLEKMFKAEFEQNSAVWSNINAVKNENVIYLGSNFAKSCGIKVLNDINELLNQLESK